MNNQLLKQFLLSANEKGYASGDNAITKNNDFSYSTSFEDHEFRLEDNWFGGEPFGGNEVVFYKNKPFWMMVYYGSDSQKAEGLIVFLRKALSNTDKKLPVRGPKVLIDKDFKYKNVYKGNLERFIGEEIIYYLGKEVYSANYIGGLVDQRRDRD